jgi:RNA polymerase sigma-70 factor (ECF subfamily)
VSAAIAANAGWRAHRLPRLAPPALADVIASWWASLVRFAAPLFQESAAFPDDLARVRGAAASRAQAGALMAEILPRVRNLVRYLVRGDQAVDDLAQEALVAILRGLPGYRGDAPLLAWVDRIVVRSTFERRRRERVRHTREGAEIPADDAPLMRQSAPEIALDRRALVAALEAMNPQQRDALVLHHVVGMSVPEVASALEAPLETVRSRLRLGMSQLRERLAIVPPSSTGEEAIP